MQTNKHGLKRSDLTSEQRRHIRQSAGFGCVICGNALGEYEHVDPPFADAKIHDPANMTFLCIQCHGKVTRGFLSKATVKAAMLNPRAKQTGFSFEAFDVGSTPPTVHFGPLLMSDCDYLIFLNDHPVFWIEPPEAPGGPFRLNAELKDRSGNVIMSIVQNEWRVRSGQWDADVTGPKIVLRREKRQIALIMRSVPPNDIHVEFMDMSDNGTRLNCDGRTFTVTPPDCLPITVARVHILHFEMGVYVWGENLGIGQGGRPGIIHFNP